MPRLFVLALFIAFSTFSQTKMTTEESDALRDQVLQKSKMTKTITSDFIQYKHLDFLSNDIESRGKLAYKVPNIISWQYISPFPYTIIFKDEKLFINDNGNKTVMDLGSNELFKQLNRLIGASISGDMFHSNDFEISYFKANSLRIVHFLPKNPEFSEFIKAFQITFSNEGTVDEVKMIEPSGDYTQILFSNRTENKAIPDAVFIH